MNEEVKNENNNVDVTNSSNNEVVTEKTNVNMPSNSSINNGSSSESLIDKENINLAPITKPSVHFDNKTETSENSNVSNTPSIPANPTDNGNGSGDFIEKEKKKWPIILLIVLLLLGGAFYYYYFVLTKPSTLFNKVIDATYTQLSNKIDSNVNNVTKNFNKSAFTGKLILTSENANFAIVNGLTVNADVEYDKDNKEVYAGVTGTLLGIEMANAKVMVDGEYGYFNVKTSENDGITYKTKLDSGITDITKNKDLEKYTNAYKYLLDSAKKTFLSNVSESKITKTPMMMDVDGKKVPSYKINYTYDKDENDKIEKAILNAYLSDNKALEELVNIGAYESIDDAKNDLKDEIDGKANDENKDNKFKTFNVIIYIDMFNNDLLGFDITAGDNEKLNVKISGNSYNAVLTYKDEKDETMSYTISLSYDNNENRYVLDVDFPSIMGSVIDSIGTSTDTNYEKKNYRTKFSVVYKENKVDDKKTEYTLSVKYFEPTNTDKEYFVVDATGEINAIDDIKTLDTTNAVDFDALDETTKSNILGSLIGIGE